MNESSHAVGIGRNGTVRGSSSFTSALRAAWIVLAMMLTPAVATAQQMVPAPAGAPQAFTTPQAAVDAFIAALRSSDRSAMQKVMGANYRQFVPANEVVADELRERFLAAYAGGSKLVMQGDAKALLEVGNQGWLFPIPIVRAAGGWRFDVVAGAAEIRNRAIGRNELAVIQAMLALVDAQNEYAALDPMRSGIRQYAQRLMSSPSKKDGLHWPSGPGDPESPIGDLVAKAQASSTNVKDDGYFGYRFRILNKQGRNAAGGAYEYLVNGRMIGGFAVIAHPARYGETGIMTFVVSHEGIVYEKDLGPNTGRIAAQINSYDPDKSWEKADMTP